MTFCTDPVIAGLQISCSKFVSKGAFEPRDASKPEALRIDLRAFNATAKSGGQRG